MGLGSREREISGGWRLETLYRKDQERGGELLVKSGISPGIHRRARSKLSGVTKFVSLA